MSPAKNLETQCKGYCNHYPVQTPAKARVANVLDENGPRLLSFIAQYNGVSVEYLVDSGVMHSFVKHNIVVKTGCTTVAMPILSVTLADENTVVSDSISCLDLTVVVGAKTEYFMPRVPCRVLP